MPASVSRYCLIVFAIIMLAILAWMCCCVHIWIAGAWERAFSALRIPVGQSGGARLLGRDHIRASPALCSLPMPVPVHWEAPDHETARQVETNQSPLLGVSVRVVWLAGCGLPRRHEDTLFIIYTVWMWSQLIVVFLVQYFGYYCYLIIIIEIIFRLAVLTESIYNCFAFF